MTAKQAHLSLHPPSPATLTDPTREEDLTPFLAQPWFRTLLSAPTYQALPLPNRRPPLPLYNACTSSFFGQTLWSAATMPSYHLCRLSAADSTSTIPTTTPSSPHPSANLNVHSCYPYVHHALYALGSGLDGMTHRLHGGVVSAILDQEMGVCATTAWAAFSTVKLEVEFIKPVETPGVVVVRTWVHEAEGRRCIVWARVENGAGGVYATGKGVFVRMRGVEKL